MRLAYADPPYPGCAHLYKDHPDFAGEVGHVALAAQLHTFDGFVLHTSSVALADLLPLFPGCRILAWVKPFAAFKPNVPLAYAWEPVILKPARKQSVDGAIVMRDWIDEPITLRRGLVGVKPERVCQWLFHCLGARRDDELVDMFPGTGAVTRAWSHFQQKRNLFEVPHAH